VQAFFYPFLPNSPLAVVPALDSSATVKMAPKAVTEHDDAILQELMEKRERENTQVSGDEDFHDGLLKQLNTEGLIETLTGQDVERGSHQSDLDPILQELMEKRERENTQVSGDEDSESDDE
jgi:ribosomal protein S19E (S16A)